MMGPKATAIIQARMTSTRLPGKVLMEVMGRPLLSYQIERLRFSKRIDKIIIATTTNKEDNPIAELARKEGLRVYRGSEEDVLDRYYQTAKSFGVRHVMRLSSDCPLLEPAVCEKVIANYFETNADYVRTGHSFAEGLDCELLSFVALKHSWKEAHLMSEREHVTLYIRNHPEKFRSFVLENDTDDSRYRITVDRENDFLVVKALLENLYQNSEIPFSIDDIKNFLDFHENIFALNADVIRNEGLLKSLREDRDVHD